MAQSIQDQLRGARAKIIKSVRSKDEWKRLGAVNKIKKDAAILKEYGVEKFTDKTAAEAFIDVARKYKTMKNFDKSLKNDFGFDPKMRDRVKKAIFKNEMSVKDLKNTFKLSNEEAEKVFFVTKGQAINKTGLGEARKKIERIRRRNVAMSVRARDNDDELMSHSLSQRREKGQKNAIRSMENEDSGRLGVSGINYSAGIGTKKVSTQDFRGKRGVSATGNSFSQTSGSGIAQSGGVLNPGKGAASVAGGFGNKPMPNSGVGRGSAPLGFRKAA